MLSSWATSTIEEVMAAMTTTTGKEGVLWLQLYIYKDRDLTLSLVHRAEEAGYKAIFVTVDTPYLGRRRNDVRNHFKLPQHLRYSFGVVQYNLTVALSLHFCFCVSAACLTFPQPPWHSLRKVMAMTAACPFTLPNLLTPVSAGRTSLG